MNKYLAIILSIMILLIILLNKRVDINYNKLNSIIKEQVYQREQIDKLKKDFYGDCMQCHDRGP